MTITNLIDKAYLLLAKQTEINHEQGISNNDLNEWLMFYDNLSNEVKGQITSQLEFVQNINE